MNLSQFGHSKYSENISYINFNQDSSGFLITTPNGLTIFQIDPLEMKFNLSELGPIKFAEMFFQASLVTYVSEKEPTVATLFHILENRKIVDITQSEEIIWMGQNQKRLIICTKSSIEFYDIKKLSHLGSIEEKNENTKFAFSSNDKSLFGFSHEKDGGYVSIFDALHMKKLFTVKCHKTQISTLSFDQESTVFATTSITGTLVRIFEVESPHNPLKEFRRGTQKANVYSTAFSYDTSFLCLSSDHGTLHIFKFKKKSTETKESQGNFQALTQKLSSGKAFAYCSHGIKIPHICSFMFQKVNEVVVIGCDGRVKIYQFNVEKGGECKLITDNNFFLAIDEKKDKKK
ncbi:autophagy-related 18a isoform e [Anaeramoeba ignava]|uniref:Autophagy-related 18a isoform e n=1 Tax=Anaeramoeba ignava TaxID=1746090 RepID=A0A9Q0R656_ANAIG|nr:autophagy-related 18a isoform e [Anaeramoeba ignava]